MRRLPFVLALVVVACAGPAAGPEVAPLDEQAAVSAAPATTTTPATPPTPAPPSTTVAPATGVPEHLVATETSGRGGPVDVYAPAEVGPWPVIVTVHGGGWYGGSPDTMAPLADGLAARGAVVYNASYRTIRRRGRFPDTVDDVACAAANAVATASRYTTTPGAVVLVGHSAGAHLAALATLAPGRFGTACGWAGAAGFVGLAGPYNTDLLGFLLEPFFGTRFAEDPEPWKAGNPLTYAADPREMPVLLLHGDADEVVAFSFTEELAAALAEGGPVEAELLAGVDHASIIDPQQVADRILAFAASVSGP
jgi:acetyl esterase/lipase